MNTLDTSYHRVVVHPDFQPWLVRDKLNWPHSATWTIERHGLNSLNKPNMASDRDPIPGIQVCADLLSFLFDLSFRYIFEEEGDPP